MSGGKSGWCFKRGEEIIEALHKNPRLFDDVDRRIEEAEQEMWEPETDGGMDLGKEVTEREMP